MRITPVTLAIANAVYTERGYIDTIKFLRRELRDKVDVAADQELARAKMLFALHVQPIGRGI
jgi:hypothetical protein